MLEPNPGGAHDDHVHVRVACTNDELAMGCEKNGPDRPWFAAWEEAAKARAPVDTVANDDVTLALALFAPTLPLLPNASAAPTAPTAPATP
jgi:penicillin-insensitive murein endopeptidase